MLKLLACSLLTVFSLQLSAQVNDKYTMAYVRDVSGRPVNVEPPSNVDGTPWLVDDWKNGSVMLKKGTLIKDMQLKFDVYRNKLFFLRDGNVYEFADTVKDFYLDYSDRATNGLVYRSNFPPVDKNTTTTFYELLVDGKVALLKYRSKSLMEFKEIDMRKVKKYEDKQQYYLALPGNRIVKIKRDKKSLFEALPEYTNELTKIIDQQGLKNEDALITVIEQLNAAMKN